MRSVCDPLDGNAPRGQASRWLTVIDDERGTLQLEFWRGVASVHSTFRKPIAAMRAARAIFPQLKAWLRSMGHGSVFVAIPEGDEKLYRFERSFGFVEKKRVRGWIIMKQEC